MVRFDIEIIPPGEINIASGLSRCLRECVTQLLVLEQRKPVKFSIKVQTCLKLASALHLAGLK
eukprot:gene55600-76187_t